MNKQLPILLVLFFYSFGQTFAIPVNESVSNVSITVFGEVNTPKINLSNATYIKNETFTINNLSERRKIVESNYKSKFGKNWKIKWKKNSDIPKILHGNHNLDEKIEDETEAKRISQSFLAENKDIFKVNVSELKLSRIIEDFNSFDIYYQQYHQNVPVERARVSMVIHKDGIIKTVGNGFHPNISMSTMPNITREEAVQIVNESYPPPRFGFLPSYLGGETSLVILPREENGSINSYLTWKVPLQGFTVYVDANTGEVISEYLTELPSTLSGTITGDVYPLDDSTYPPGGILTEKNLSNLRIWVDGGTWNVKDWTIFDGSYETSDFPDGAYIDFGVSLNATHFGSCSSSNGPSDSYKL